MEDFESVVLPKMKAAGLVPVVLLAAHPETLAVVVLPCQPGLDPKEVRELLARAGQAEWDISLLAKKAGGKPDVH